MIVTFLPSGRRGAVEPGELLIEGARRLGVRIASACGGRGRCRSCGVRVEGAVPPADAADREVFSAAELAAGWRRACRTRIIGPCHVHVPARAAAAAMTRGQHGEVRPVGIVEPVRREGGLGLAVDLGTTNIAASLVDLGSGHVLATGAAENPQAAYGGDVVSRGSRALQAPAVAMELRRLAVEAIAGLAAGLTEGDGAAIAEIAVAGNTVMHHLLLGLPLGGLMRAPFRPHAVEPAALSAAEAGLRFAPVARLYVGPNMGGFVGSDHVAALLEALADPPSGSWVLLDIGTNTEISLIHDGRLTSTSCASGPAFEGGMLSCGMRAGPGAVERIENGAIVTIDGAEPVGICGSGVLSLLAELKRSGAVDGRGRLRFGHAGVRERAGQREFVLADEAATGGLPVVFTQEDVRAVQLAKAAIRAGLTLLLAEAGLAEGDLQRVVVAGAFGRFIGIADAVAIGLLPPLPAERVVQVGNVAAAGVRRLVACHAERRRADQLAGQARCLDLAARPAFHKTFINAIGL